MAGLGEVTTGRTIDPGHSSEPTTDTAIATLTRDKENSDGNGKFAIYTYADTDSVPTIDNAADTANTTPTDTDRRCRYLAVQRFLNDAARSFTDRAASGSRTSEAHRSTSPLRLYPMAKRNSDGKKNAADVAGTLSFEHAAEDPTYAKDAREGAWVLVEDCVTYLLYPFVTCGATAGWTTGISVSNTSKDDGRFRSV